MKRMRLAHRLLLGFTIFFIAFAAFTTFAPCKYSSLRAVERQLGLVASAADGGPTECECNPAGLGTDPLQCQMPCSIETEYGCGFLWMLPCTMMWVNPPIVVGLAAPKAGQTPTVPGLKPTPPPSPQKQNTKPVL